MPQPATDSHENPIVYLMGFSCLPGDGEYAEAQRATGSATPYWFKEKVVYEEPRAKTHTRKTAATEPKSNMAGVHMHDKKDKTAKEKAKPVKERAKERLGTAEGNSGIKEMKNETMKMEENNKKDKKTETQESMENMDKKKAALNPQRNKPPFKKKPNTVARPRKRVRFAWNIPITAKRRVSHAPPVQNLSKKSPTHDTKPRSKKSNNRDNTPVDLLEETLKLLGPLPTSRSGRQTLRLFYDVPHQRRKKGTQATSRAPLSQTKSKSKTRAQAQVQAQRGRNTNGTNIYSLEPNPRVVRHVQKEQKTSSVWSILLGFCFGKRK